MDCENLREFRCIRFTEFRITINTLELIILPLKQAAANMGRILIKVKMQSTTLTANTLSRLKCDLCHGYLSIPPISSYRDQNACGRCSPDWPRNTIYEQLAKYASFPCIYCNDDYAWGLIQHHEKKCKGNRLLCPAGKDRPYKTGDRHEGEYHKKCQRRVRCPFELCLVAFDIQNIVQHFKQYHKDYVFTNSVEANKILKVEKIWDFKSDTKVCIIQFDSIPFLLYIHSDCNFNGATGDIIYYNYYFSVFTFCLEGCKRIDYSTSLQASSRDETITNKHQNIQIYNDKIHSVQFLHRDLFKLNSFDFMTTKIEGIERAEHMALRYSVKIQLRDNSTKELPETVHGAFDLIGIERHFECPICKEYMHPPIYNCSTGHTICRYCRDKLSTCPYCQAVVGRSRNFVLEDILETLLLQCHNEHKGCKYAGRIQEIKLHEMSCSYN
ncbi:unnamed protein product [Phyllotreta striolata]|uniref:E3 ubiquitin-protein ligase Sina-like RING finger domain-containing protein n=1 Tax=Phyllotreta striolata TaxID=444603 RepID=A0A9N9TU90_PHYSR|nr:unnamed protein product [Phyllotreta striolata]